MQRIFKTALLTLLPVFGRNSRYALKKKEGRKMKRLSFIISLLVVWSIFNCSKSATTSIEGNHVSKDTPQYSLLGTLHNDGLDYCLTLLPDSAGNDTIIGLAEDFLDSAGVAVEFIPYSGDEETKDLIKVVLDTLCVDSTTLMGILSNTGHGNLISDMSLIVHEIKTGDTDDLKDIESGILNSNYREIEKDILLSGISLGIKSIEFWTGKLNKATSVQLLGIAFADAVGGIVGGLVGGGPGGWSWYGAGLGALGCSMIAAWPL